jgi:hypothetical protein
MDGRILSMGGGNAMLEAVFADLPITPTATPTVAPTPTPTNVVPVVHAGPDTAINEGSTFVGNGFFTDPDANTWSATVDYGEGSGVQPLVMNPNKTFALQHFYVDNGVYMVRVSVQDSAGAEGVDTVMVTVDNVAPRPTASGVPAASPEGTTVTLVGSATDPSPMDTVAGFAYAWSVTKNGSPYASGSGANFGFTPDDDGAYVVTLSATDKDTGTGSTSVTIDVTNVAPTPSIAGAPATSPEGTAIALAGSATDPSLVDTAVGFSFAWAVTKNGNPFASGAGSAFTFTPDDDATYVVMLSVTDRDTGAGFTSVTINVTNVPPTLTEVTVTSPVNENGIAQLAGRIADAGVLDTFVLVVNWGDGSTPQTMNYPAGTTSFALQHQYLDDNPSGTPSDVYSIRLSVTDDQDTGMANRSVAVVNLPPSVGPITAPLDPIQVSTPISASVSFADPGTLDTHTALWDWGDGITSAGAVIESNGSGSVTGVHAYAAPGVYTIRLTVTDDDGGVGQSVFEYVVIYDPEGGFVTGGGWINSPAGAYVPDPLLTGRASFGFVSKYKKGATVPTGNTEFQFKTGNLNFHSESYEWLVIAGAKAMYKGVGTINGQGEYRFMLSAIDGQVQGGGGVDKFRIRIWDKVSGGLVYDNQMGAGDDADPTTAIGGGSIVIHK